MRRHQGVGGCFSLRRFRVFSVVKFATSESMGACLFAHTGFSPHLTSHHLTNFGVVPAKAICRTRTIFCESILFISFWECPRGSTHRCRRSCPCRPNWHSATICTVSCSCSGPFMMRWFVYLFVAVRRVALSVFCSLDILL